MMVDFSSKGLACSAETVCVQELYKSLGITLACSQFSPGRDSDFPVPLSCPCRLQDLGFKKPIPWFLSVFEFYITENNNSPDFWISQK